MNTTIDTTVANPEPLRQTPPLTEWARRRYALMRWLTLAGVTIGCAFAARSADLFPGALALGGLLVAYIVLVRYQYSRQAGACRGLGMASGWYLLLCALLVFGMMVVPRAATGGESLWYCVVFLVVVSEGRSLRSVSSHVALLALCIALTALAIWIIVPKANWLQINANFLALYAGLTVSALGSRLQYRQEQEHAERLVLLEELARSKADLEEANDQLQVYAGAVEQLAVANERNRLARELHDILGYTLATVVVKGEAAKRLLATDVARARGELDRMQEVARSGLAEVRQSVSGLRDPAPVKGVWREVVVRFVEEFAEQTGLAVSHHIEPLPEGHDPALELCLFRVIQEALTNVARHAQAGHVSVTLASSAGRAELSVQDDGVGIGPGTPAGGFGLRGMRERVELLGGTLVCISRRGEGVRVLAGLPLCQARGAGSTAGSADSVVPVLSESRQPASPDRFSSGGTAAASSAAGLRVPGSAATQGGG